MTRKRALECIKISGIEGDQKQFLRLYTENRISYSVALAAFREGVRLSCKAAGYVSCLSGCRVCNG